MELLFRAARFCSGCAGRRGLCSFRECQCDELNRSECGGESIIFIPLQPWEPAASSVLSSLPSPFLLTCAVRGDINLSDNLCDPPPGLGGRRRAVNINILPGVAAAMEQPRPPRVLVRDPRQEYMRPSRRLLTTRSMPSAQCLFLIVWRFLFPHRQKMSSSFPKNKIKNECFVRRTFTCTLMQRPGLKHAANRLDWKAPSL